MDGMISISYRDLLRQQADFSAAEQAGHLGCIQGFGNNPVGGTFSYVLTVSF
ncbi:hypothetical protein ACNKHO_00895 [Shigella flexneri]